MKYDLIILGAGGTGLAGAMYGARLGLKTLVVGDLVGGVIITAKDVENYPGFEKITGIELAKKLEKHARSYDLVKIKQEKIKQVKKHGKEFIVKTGKAEYKAKTILFATGTKRKKLNVKGAKKFEGKGVNYCSLCDAPLFKDKIVAVIGGSDGAVKDALILAEHVRKVYIIYRGKQIHPEPVSLEKIKKNKKIKVINNANVVEIKGDKKVKSVVLDKGQELMLNGVFVAIGSIISSELTKPLGVRLNEKQEIKINHKTSETNVAGVYAAGDVTDKHFKQLIIGVADACAAAYSAYEYINKKSERIK